MNFLNGLVGKVVRFFKSGAATKAIQQAVDLVPQAIAIVQAIDSLAPTKTMDQIAKVANIYGVQITGDVTAGANAGLALLHVASVLLARNAPGTSTSVLNAAVQLAVTGLHAK